MVLRISPSAGGNLLGNHKLLALVTLASSVALLLGCGRVVPPKDVRASEVARQAQSSRVKVGGVLLSDDFDNPAAPRLPLGSASPFIDQGYVGGEYLIRFSPSLQESSYLVGPVTLFANVHISVSARLVGGTEARMVGIACRVGSKAGRASGYYVLAVFPATGRFGLQRAGPGGVIDLVPSQASAAIRRGPASNHLELTCAGSTVAATINGIEVASARDTTFDTGLVALISGRSGSIAVEARFDNLVVREASGEP
jgi:hypothetical protein